VLLVDTAGRLAIDEALMQEIKDLHAALNPVETLFVVDAMQGQDASTPPRLQGSPAADRHHPDQDSMAIRAVARRCRCARSPVRRSSSPAPAKRSTAWRCSTPSAMPGASWAWATSWRWWSRDMAAAQKLAAKVKSGAGFDLNDFLAQIQQMKQMGGLSSLMDKLPTQMAAKAGQVDMDKAEKDIKRKEGIIHSMTPLERRKPELIKATRKRRIAAGAGVQVQEVNRLLKEFEQMQDMMKKMKGGGLMKMMKRMGGMKGMSWSQPWACRVPCTSRWA
jgi:signal recognition particle subunit SRP54